MQHWSKSKIGGVEAETSFERSLVASSATDERDIKRYLNA